MFGIKLSRAKRVKKRNLIRRGTDHSVLTRKKNSKNEVRYELFRKRDKDKNPLNLKKFAIPTKTSLVRRLRKKITKNLNLSPLLIKNQLKLSKPFSMPTQVLSKKRICEDRKARRNEIMRLTRGRGLSVKNALWTPLSKLIKCQRKK